MAQLLAILLTLMLLTAIDTGRGAVVASASDDATAEQGHQLLLALGPTWISPSGRFGAYYEDTGPGICIGAQRPWTGPLFFILESSYTRFSFVKAGFFDWEDVSNAVPVSGSSAQLFLEQFGLRMYPQVGKTFRPYADLRGAYASIKEKYRYSNLRSGSQFSSGTLIARNSSTSLLGLQGTTGVHLAISAWSILAEVGYLQLSGGDVNLSGVRIQAGVAIRLE